MRRLDILLLNLLNLLMIFLPVFRNESFTFESFHVTEKLLSDRSFELLVFGVSIGSIFFFAENLGEKGDFF